MADRQKTTDLTPRAEEGDHDLLEIINNEKPIRPRARPENRTPKTEVQKFRNGGVAEARGMKSIQLSGRNGGKTY